MTSAGDHRDLQPVLQMRGISKRYPGARALDNASLDVRAGEVHIVLGENGAGKSTLMKSRASPLRRREHLPRQDADTLGWCRRLRADEG